jgi:hypothetical protein
MINITKNDVVFAWTGSQLDRAVRDALLTASKTMLKVNELEHVDLNSVTTKTYKRAGFSKMVELCTLKKKEFVFDENYVKQAYETYMTPYAQKTPAQIYAFTLGQPNSEFVYKSSYLSNINIGMGLFLIALHSAGAITLPISFDWPFMRTEESRRVEVGVLVSSELLAFIRSLDSQSDSLSHPAFASVAGDKKRREWFLTYGTKLLLATGWNRLADVCVDDLIAIKAAETNTAFAGNMPLAYKALADVLACRFGKDINLSVEQWTAVVHQPHHRFNRRQLAFETAANTGRNADYEESPSGNFEEELLDEFLQLAPSLAWPDALKNTKRLPGLAIDLNELTKTWVFVENTYMQKVKRESYKPVLQALGYLNLYLFYYLPYWFQQNPNSELRFPDTPGKLLGSVFISRLLEPSVTMPLTFMDVMDRFCQKKQWANNGYYGTLKQIEVFFQFIERNSEQLPDSKGFKQPIAEHDYPATARSRGTDKLPIPRRLFGVFLEYTEVIRHYQMLIQTLIVDGHFDGRDIERAKGPCNVIDTSQLADIVGFVPVLFTGNRTIHLRYIPNCLALSRVRLKNGRTVKLPQPHALNQIVVALHTGLRHNHIQWLDAERFDSLVTDDDKDFTRLVVNTDKAKKHEWHPHVNMCVIQVLRDQRAWRNLIDLPSFAKRHSYNNNPASKWAKILPLFSTGVEGLPHNDSRYSEAWKSILIAIQGLLPELGEGSLHKLAVLEPPNVDFNDSDATQKRSEYGKTCTRVCELDIKTKITPHSSRVTAVSQYITFLPASVIGQHITGQTEAVVNHYVVLDNEQLAHEQAHQAMAMREYAYRNEFSDFATGLDTGKSRFIHADNVNSNLAKSLRTNLTETLVSYGCVSITMNEDGANGLDVLRETRAANAAENKTEICPYGNHCPAEVVKQWRGTNRCGLCQYAVRSVDHLPAVAAKVKQFVEMLVELTLKIETAIQTTPCPYTDAELDRLEEERARLAEELAGWQLSEEVLHAAKNRIASGQDTKEWVVQKPEVILQDLKRVSAPSNLTAYTLARLQECIAYPTLESPQIRARFDLLRRELMAKSGKLREAFSSKMPIDPAAECAGLLRSIVAANRLSYEDLITILEGDGHLAALPAPTMLLGSEDAHE